MSFTVTVYSNLVASLGGAQMIREGVRVAFVMLANGTEILMPISALEGVDREDGIAIAQAAEDYAKGVAS